MRNPWHFPLVIILVLGNLGIGSTEAQAETRRYDFILGLADADRRTAHDAQALSDRIRRRLLAARIPDHTLSVDKPRAEVKLSVVADLPPDVLRDLVVAPSRVELLLAHHDEPLLDGLQELLPKGVTLGRGRVGDRADTYLYASDSKLLEDFISTVALSDYRLLVGRLSGTGGARTWLVRRDGKGKLGAADALEIASGAHPNYHYLTAWWQRRPASSAGDHLLLVVDGRVEANLGAVPPSDDGRITVRMPAGPAARQLRRARWLGARLAAPHPAGVVVVSEKMTRTK